jgi:3-deoxy-7-phosphoheptulonate synthase
MSAPLPSPNELRRQLPTSAAASENVAERRLDVARIFDGSDSRFLLVVGPCSVHDETSALDYAERLSREARRVHDRIVVCMRVYLV